MVTPSVLPNQSASYCWLNKLRCRSYDHERPPYTGQYFYVIYTGPDLHCAVTLALVTLWGGKTSETKHFFADFRCIILPNKGGDQKTKQKRFYHSSTWPLAVCHMVNPGLP